MKNIVLVDRLDVIITYILENTDWNICVLVVQDEECKRKYVGNPRVKEIYTAVEFYYLDASSYIDFEDIENVRSEYRIIDSGMNRQRTDYHYARYNFYMGVAIWNRIFRSYSIDMCLLTGIMHGITYDNLLFSIADNYDIPCYDIYPCSKSNLVVYSQRDKKLLCFGNNDYDVKKGIISDVYYYSEVVTDGDSKKKCNIKERGVNFLFKLGGNALVQTVLCIKARTASIEWYPGRKEKVNIFLYLHRFLEMKYIFRLNDKYSVKADYNKNYVVYFLHFEPEAAVTHNATVMDSQLIIIKMIANSLPEDWKLYVKEHPYSRNSNNKKGMAHFTEFIPKYQSKWFFDMIRNTENVDFINVNESATELLKHSRACATIAGTITKECIIEKKPCLLFGDPSRNIFSKECDLFFIKSSEECKKVLQKINDGFVPEYNNIENISSKYSISKDGDYLKKIIEVIKKDLLYERDEQL